MITLIVLSILGSLVLLFASLNAAANYDKWASIRSASVQKETIRNRPKNHWIKPKFGCDRWSYP